MTSEEKARVTELIKCYCKPSRHYYKLSSYSLKEIFEKLANCYIHNEEFKKLMIEAGFTPTPRSKINHYYKLEIIPDQNINCFYWGAGCEAWRYEKRIKHKRLHG